MWELKCDFKGKETESGPGLGMGGLVNRGRPAPRAKGGKRADQPSRR